MKKFLLFLALFSLATVNSYAISKKEKKEITKTAKQMSKDGWYSQIGRNIEDLLIEAKNQEENGCLVFVGTAYDLPSSKQAKQKARFYATTELAEFAAKHKETTDSKTSSMETDEWQVTQFNGKTSITIDGKSFNTGRVLFELIRQPKPGKFDCMVYLLCESDDE